MHLISLLAGLLLSCTAAFAASVAARANETTGGYVGPVSIFTGDPTYCRPFPIRWEGQGPINITVTLDSCFSSLNSCPVEKYIGLNTYEKSFDWIVDVPRWTPPYRISYSTWNGGAIPSISGLTTHAPSSSSCDQSLLGLPFDAASMHSAGSAALTGGRAGWLSAAAVVGASMLFI